MPETLCPWMMLWMSMSTGLLSAMTPAAGWRIPVTAVLAPAVPRQTITVCPGDNVPLTCLAPSDMSFDALEVIKRGLEGGYVSFLMDGRLDVENQLSSYKGRVELVEPLMKNNVTLILKNVTLSDSGVYECHFITNGRETDGNGSFGTKSSYNINLDVRDQTAGGEEERGDLRKEDGGDTTGQNVNGTEVDIRNKDEGNRNHHVVLILSAVFLSCILAVLLFFCSQNPRSSRM